MKKKSSSIDIVYTRELNNFVRSLNTNIRKNVKTVRRQFQVLRKYFLTYEEPYSEISQNCKHLTINVKLPKTKKRDIRLRIVGNQVQIEGISRAKGSAKGFYRTIDLPENTATEKAKAVFKNETLRIKLPLFSILRR